MSQVYSQRNRQASTTLREDLSQDVRTRILAALRDQIGEYSPMNFDGVLDEIGKKLIKLYGRMERSSYNAAVRSETAALEHYSRCDEDKALDFIELFFQSQGYTGRQDGVDEINTILREEGIGYYFTDYVERDVPSTFNGQPCTLIQTEYPRAIKRTNTQIHEQIVVPTLTLLEDSRLSVAYSEMLKAHEAYRRGDWDDVITLCCASFESLLKTICDLKGWPRTGRETCGTLVGICRANYLFPSFYTQMFEAVGTVRNNIGSAHGRGPAVLVPAEQVHAEHHLNITGSHMLFLAKLAGMR